MIRLPQEPRLIGPALRSIRHLLGIEQRDIVAAGVGNQGVISSLENGHTAPQIGTIQRYLGTFDFQLAAVPVGYGLCDCGRKTNKQGTWCCRMCRDGYGSHSHLCRRRNAGEILGMAQPESKLSRAIIAMIKAGGGYAVKFHGGPMTEAGTPDILACIPIHPEGPHSDPVGIFVGIETKMPDKRHNVSPIQAHRHEQIRTAGGVVIVATSVQEAMNALEALGWIRTNTPGD